MINYFFKNHTIFTVVRESQQCIYIYLHVYWFFHFCPALSPFLSSHLWLSDQGSGIIDFPVLYLLLESLTLPYSIQVLIACIPLQNELEAFLQMDRHNEIVIWVLQWKLRLLQVKYWLLPPDFCNQRTSQKCVGSLKRKRRTHKNVLGAGKLQEENLSLSKFGAGG